MEFQKTINLLHITPDQPLEEKEKAKKWTEINDISRGTYDKNSQI